MSVLIGKNLGDITNLANDYLPKSAIDRATIRMAELLQHRMGAAPNIDKATTTVRTDSPISDTPTSTTSTSSEP